MTIWQKQEEITPLIPHQYTKCCQEPRLQSLLQHQCHKNEDESSLYGSISAQTYSPWPNPGALRMDGAHCTLYIGAFISEQDTVRHNISQSLRHNQSLGFTFTSRTLQQRNTLRRNTVCTQGLVEIHRKHTDNLLLDWKNAIPAPFSNQAQTEWKLFVNVFQVCRTPNSFETNFPPVRSRNALVAFVFCFY